MRTFIGFSLFLLSLATAEPDMSTSVIEQPKETKVFDIVVPSNILEAVQDPNNEYDVIFKDQDDHSHTLPMQSLGTGAGLPPLNALFLRIKEMISEQSSVQQDDTSTASPETVSTPSASPTMSPGMHFKDVSQDTSSTSSSSVSSETSGALTPPAKGDYKAQIIYRHNKHRSNHSAPKIAWDDDLAKIAQDICDSCVYAHDVNKDGGHYGQNIGYGYSGDDIGAMITSMYNGEMTYYANLYGQGDPGQAFEKVGHFTQIVWKETSKVGCATKLCQTLEKGPVGQASNFSVCNYRATGNIVGSYGKNVGRPLGHPSIAV